MGVRSAPPDDDRGGAQVVGGLAQGGDRVTLDAAHRQHDSRVDQRGEPGAGLPAIDTRRIEPGGIRLGGRAGAAVPSGDAVMTVISAFARRARAAAQVTAAAAPSVAS